MSPTPISFNPDAPATAAPTSSSGGVRFTPTRPGTPAAGTLAAAPVTDVTPTTTYIVKSGDSLWSVAKKHHITVAQLTAANNIMADTAVHPGKKLLIPGKAGSPVAAPASSAVPAASKPLEPVPAASAPHASSDAVKHVVKSGESLSTIARTYGVKQGEIAVLNNISDPAKIKAGDQLIIPGYQTPVSKSGRTASKSGTKNGDNKTAAPKSEPLPSAQVEQTPAAPPPPQVPVIKIDDSPITPAPKP